MKTRTCNKCKIEKPIAEFSWKLKARGIRLASCKACHSAYTKRWYKRNKKRQVANAAKNNRRYRKEKRAKFFLWLAERECVVCKESDMRVLEMHHRDPKEKEFTPLRMIERGWAWSKIILELEKCDVLCANCHKREHFAIVDGVRIRKVA